MLKVKVIAFGKCKEEWLRLALLEYEKRLSSQLKLSWVEPRDVDHLEELLRQEKKCILLDPAGDSLDSVEFSHRFMRALEQNGSKVSFAIGPPDGFSPKIAMPRWSLSALTFTHQLTRLVLIEQIYRALEIAKGSPYHK